MKRFLIKIIGFTLNLISYFASELAAKIAIKIFSTPQKGKLKNLDAHILKVATKQAIKYENLSIMTYHWKGYKDTILLAHGWESNSSRWQDLIEALITFNYNVIALDAPAHGNSSGKLFNALLFSECIHLVAKKFQADVVIGHSVGGMATVFFQHKYQLPSIKKLVLLGAPSNFEGVFNRYSKMMRYNKRVVEAMNQYILKNFNHLPNHFSAAKFSSQISSKGLIIHDEKDLIIPFSDALDYKKNYTNSELISTKGQGHGLKSQVIYNHILDFLKC